MKKVLLLLATCGVFLAQAAPKSKKTKEIEPIEPADEDTFVYDTMTRGDLFRFSFNVTQHFWAGFIDGWYLHSKHKMSVDEDCFGSWIEDDFWEIDNVFWKIVYFEWMSLEAEEVKQAAVDVVDIFFK